ncbi:MAG: 16S rRNA (adenine(1518)-N(6)/adenine(1519)-N(6))-dimethyltransferase RsmA [Bacteroidales bacterium]
MYEVRAKKHLGQHFLKDENIAFKIADSLSPLTRQVLEVGPGTGVLTKYLVKAGFDKFVAVEIDRESAAFLRTNYPQLGEGLIEADILRMELVGVFEGQFSVIGNFPYNISSQILFRVLENHDQINEVVGMFQKEVAVRIAAPPGKKDYGILSVLLQAWYDIEYLFTVEPTVFVPPPKVQSAVIRLLRNQTTELGCSEKLLLQVVKTAFNQRRKTLHNALKPLGDYNGEFAGKRAEQLSVAQFVSLTNSMQSIINDSIS